MTGRPKLQKPSFSGVAALRFGLHTIARHPIFFLVSASAADLLGRGVLLLHPTMPAHPRPEELPALVPGVLLRYVIGILTGVAYISVALACSKDRAPAFADLWPGGRTVLRFARASMSYGFMMVLLYVVGSFAGGTGYAQYLMYTRGAPFSIWLAGFGAAMLAIGFLVGRWLVDRQFFGHLVVDRHLGGNAALRASVPLARLVRWSLLVASLVPLAIAAAFATVAVMLTDFPGMPRPLGIPRIGADWPPVLVSAVDQAVIVLDTLVAWLGVLALTFVYRTAERWLGTAPASSSTEGGAVR